MGAGGLEGCSGGGGARECKCDGVCVASLFFVAQERRRCKSAVRVGMHTGTRSLVFRPSRVERRSIRSMGDTLKLCGAVV